MFQTCCKALEERIANESNMTFTYSANTFGRINIPLGFDRMERKASFLYLPLPMQKKKIGDNDKSIEGIFVEPLCNTV